MASGNGGQLMAHALKREGVEVLFTLCGGHITPAYLAADELGIRVIDFRHEQAAAMAADALARLSRRPQVALVTAGPGVTNAVTAVANAAAADSPLVLIGGKSPFYNLEQGSLQEMEQVDMFRPITCWARSCWETRRIPEYVEMAFRHARTQRAPVFLEVPTDLLYGFGEAELPPPLSPAHWGGRPPADPALVEQAARLLAQSERAVLLAGSTVWWDDAAAALQALAEQAHLPVYTNGMGRGCMPPEHPLFFQLTRGQALGEADAVVLIGVPLDFRMGYGRNLGEHTRLIRIENRAERLAHVRAPAVGLCGDARAVLEQLCVALAAEGGGGAAARSARQGWVQALRAAEEHKRAAQREQGRSDQVPISHQRLAQEIADLVDADTVVVGDGGDIVGCAAKYIPVPAPGHWLDPGPFGCLGVGPPFALAAKLFWPHKKVILLSGDGALGLNGFDLDTAIRHRLPFVTVVGNDGGWGQIRNPQTQMFGEQRTLACELEFSRYDRFIEAFGGRGERVERPEQIRPALERALAAETCALVDVVISKHTMAGSNYMRGL
ncbi:MAG: acetolactate synthase [Planctomycetota bacterium]|nr:MAG: acetolactate synthase [Planctomycetota bacterium]